jgi:hypothetical protein
LTVEGNMKIIEATDLAITRDNIGVETALPLALAPVELANIANERMNEGRVEEGLASLIAGLAGIRPLLSAEDWQGVGEYLRGEHPICAKLFQDPMTRRALEKPRGYAGDAVMMDYLYGIHYGKEAEAQASTLGRAILRHIRSLPTSRGVVWRRHHIAGLIDGFAASRPELSVLAIASGHLREVECSDAALRGRVKRFVALDADAESLREVAKCYGYLGVQTAHGSVRDLVRRKAGLGMFDFVYAAGLYDYLADNVGQALTARMFEMTKPGGTLLIPNYAPTTDGRGYMECFMDWHLIYRDEYDMLRLLEQVDPAGIESYDIYADPWKSVVYLSVKKAR